MGGEHDRVVWKVIERLELNRMSRDGARASEMDLAKFYDNLNCKVQTLQPSLTISSLKKIYHTCIVLLYRLLTHCTQAIDAKKYMMYLAI